MEKLLKVLRTDEKVVELLNKMISYRSSGAELIRCLQMNDACNKLCDYLWDNYGFDEKTVSAPSVDILREGTVNEFHGIS